MHAFTGTDLALVLVALLPVLYLSIVVHELGHAVLGWLAGWRITSLGMGTGRPLLVLSWRGVRVYFCRNRPLQGLTFLYAPQLYPARSRTVSKSSAPA